MGILNKGKPKHGRLHRRVGVTLSALVAAVSMAFAPAAMADMQGIDVSTFQQDIDWQAVADSGIAFAVIRAGYRGYGKGSIVEDDRFRQNVAGACAAGLRVGLYFFSQAVTPEEAAEEAQWLVDAAHDYQIDMPLVFDWENIDQSTVAAGALLPAVLRRGKNASKATVAKHATVQEYRASTGFECLLGWLYLTGQMARVEELFDALWQQFDPNQK